jgi:hypothetical protein
MVRNALIALAVLAAAGCNRKDAPQPEPIRPPPAEPAQAPASPAAAPVPAPPAAPIVAPSPAPAPPADPEASENACAKPKNVKPAELAAQWPGMIGQCVRFSGRIDRALDMTRSLVQAGSATFIVWLPPGAAWTGSQTHNFVVMGAGQAAIHGKTALPELMLQTE